MSIFGDSDIYGDDILNENVRGIQIPEDDNNENNQEDNNGDEDSEKKDEVAVQLKLEPKRRVRRLININVNPDLLMGKRGVHTVENHFKDIKFQGKGYEKEDLNNIMKRLEHWSHRLLPKYSFNDNLTAIETQGKKKIVQVHMTKYRRNMLDDQLRAGDGSDDEENGNNGEGRVEQNLPFDEMDELLEQQISKHDRTGHNSTVASNRDHDFDSLCSPGPSTSSAAARSMVIDSPMAMPIQQDSSQQLAADKMAIIAENRRRAQEKLRESRMKNILSTSDAVDHHDQQ